MNKGRPNPVELRYGQDQYEIGYADGYKKCLSDLRKRRLTKDKTLKERFHRYADYMEDFFAANRKR